MRLGTLRTSDEERSAQSIIDLLKTSPAKSDMSFQELVERGKN